MQDLIIYHGSQQTVEVPKYGVGKKYNDYGQGFYCTESVELAKEWACPVIDPTPEGGGLSSLRRR